MTEWTLHSTPPPGGVLREQVRAVGLTLRMPAIVAAALLALATLLVTAHALRGDATIGFHPERWVLPGLAGALFPLGVWIGETRFGAGFLWTLPVDRRRHALARVGAGWVWLMAAVACFVLWLLAFALLSGGNVVGEETLRMVSHSALAPNGTVDPGAVRTAVWRPEPLLWLAPFTAATGAYLLASALALGTRHPLRWIVGTVLGFFLFAAVAEAANSAVLLDVPSRVLGPLLSGPWSLETLLVARTESLKVETMYATGERVVVWLGFPDVGQWAVGTLVWLAAGLLALWAAASRHRETRRR